MESVGLYVDVENLLDIAKQAIQYTHEQWPEEFPQPNLLRLYVRADQTELWDIWATNKFPELDVMVKGVQHFTLKGSKNSADISIALDALADLLKGRITHVAILSDDSDFASLFAKIKQEAESGDSHKIPFIWFVTDRPDTRSPTLSDFLPPDYLHMISCADIKSAVLDRDHGYDANESLLNEEEQIAENIIRHIPVGSFKSTDCMRMIAHYFPQHSLAKVESVTFGTQFSKIIWPILGKYGVRLIKQGKGSRKYEMTEVAKEKVGSSETL